MELNLSAFGKSEKNFGEQTDSNIQISHPAGHVKVYKYYLEISVYPNGKAFPRVIPLGDGYKQGRAKKKRGEASKVEDIGEEVW